MLNKMSSFVQKILKATKGKNKNRNNICKKYYR